MMPSTTQPYNESQTQPRQQLAMEPGKDIVTYFKAYAKEKPEVAALWCFGVGFVLGWKLKPW